MRHWFSAHKVVLSDKTKLMRLSISGNERHFGSFTSHYSECEKYIVDRDTCSSSDVAQTYFVEKFSANCFSVAEDENF